MHHERRQCRSHALPASTPSIGYQRSGEEEPEKQKTTLSIRMQVRWSRTRVEAGSMQRAGSQLRP